MVKQYGKRIAGESDDGNVRHYSCDTTDLKATWPTDCGDGSTMTVVNKTTGVVDRYEGFFEGDWAIL